jgi:hypothetical protein
MPSLIESLVDAPLVRPDTNRMAVTLRPAPERLREILEVFGAMGNTASFPGLKRSIDLRHTEPRILANVVLGRWLTTAEVDALGPDYVAWRHFKSMLVSEEFRRPFVRRVLEAFAEKKRLLHVRIPSCAGRHVTALIEHGCPLIPTDVGAPRYSGAELLGPLLGRLFNKIAASRAVAVSLPAMSAFVDPPAIKTTGPDRLHWGMDQAPYRAVDLLFAIVRPPESLALSQVNGALTQLRLDPETKSLRQIRARLGNLPDPGQHAEWQRLARRLLHESLPENPICHALGDGTAAGAITACTRVPIELVSLHGYTEWARPALDPAPLPPIGVSEKFLAEADLTPQDRDIINTRMAEDLAFYARFEKCMASSGLPMVRGQHL